MLAVLCLIFPFLCLTQSCTLPMQDASDILASSRPRRDLTTNCGPDDVVPPNRVNTTERLSNLRERMANYGVHAYYVPLDDVGRRTWISGFSGSSGDAIVTFDQAVAWTDGRYFLQASQELDCNWSLMKMGQPGVPSYTQFLSDLPIGTVVAFDPAHLGAQDVLDMRKALSNEGVNLTSLQANLIDEIWTEENGRPPQELKIVTPHDIRYAGKGWPEKIFDLRETLIKEGVEAMVVTEQDEIAWLFNIRGQGTSTNQGLMHSPLFDTLSLVTLDDIFLWINTDKVAPGLLLHLTPPNCMENRTCTVIGDLRDSLNDIRTWASTTNSSVLITKPSTYLAGASFAVYESIPEQSVRFKDSPIMLAKNIKNEVEVEGMISAHVKDAVALSQFAAHLESEIGCGNWTELSASSLLEEYRRKQPLNDGISFSTIAAFGPNSAVIHYSPTPETDARIDESNIFLVDSGGQYYDGTTDVTRTFHYGNPVPRQVEMYTRVLMGAIDLASAVIPINTKDGAIDLVTRQYLFEKGLNYRHGTGHGIGSYLKVHEGPINIHMHSGARTAMTGSLAPNMFFSDEPGFYQDGEFGIRLETVLRVVKASFMGENQTFGEFVKFEPVTLVPFEPKLIDYSLMTIKQLEWLNRYNEIILNEVVPQIDPNDERTLSWIYGRTQFVSPALSHEVQKWANHQA